MRHAFELEEPARPFGIVIDSGGGGFQRALFRAAIGLILFLMWGEFFRHLVDSLAPAPGPFLFWLGRELAWWAVVSLLGGLLACFALESETVRGLAATLAPRRLAARKAPCSNRSSPRRMLALRRT